VVFTVNPSCAKGNTVWSPLLNLTNGTSYKACLYTPSFCAGYESAAGYCLETDTTPGAQQDCNSVCGHFGQIPTDSCYESGDSDNCSAIEALKGAPCLTCSPSTLYSFYDNSGNCYYHNFYDASCSAAPSGVTRVCACYHASAGAGFLFPFTASF
jgi:hypothetical protein